MKMFESFILPGSIEINASDILLILVVACAFETIVQAYSLKISRKSEREKEIATSLLSLKYQCAESKKLGPESFVETSKLERGILSCEKQLQDIQSEKESQLGKIKGLSSRISYVLYAIIAAMYWKVPMLLLHDMGKDGNASGYLRKYFFPLQFGISSRIANIGQPSGSVGPLFVFWAGQAFTSEVFTCLVNILDS